MRVFPSMVELFYSHKERLAHYLSIASLPKECKINKRNLLQSSMWELKSALSSVKTKVTDQILALIVSSTQKHSVLGKPHQLVALIQVLSLGKFVILFEWRTRQIVKYFRFFKKILQIFIFIFFFSPTSLFPFLSSLSSSCSEPLDKLEACFSTLNISNALVFNFPERAYPERGWFPYSLFWPLCSPLTYFSSCIIFAHLGWRKCLNVEAFTVAVLWTQLSVTLISSSHQGHNILSG